MHSVNRPAVEPPALATLRQSGGEDFGSLGASLDQIFRGVCAYCERTIRDDDVVTRGNGLFFCDHFRPRHMFDGLIYDWSNLVYVCGECADVKGGQWPQSGESADEYIDPCAKPGEDGPDDVFRFDLSDGSIQVSSGLPTLTNNRAIRTRDDLALNAPRGARREGTAFQSGSRRTNLAEVRRQRVRRLTVALDAYGTDPDALEFIIGEFTDRSARFSSICRQVVEQSEHRHYLS